MISKAPRCAAAPDWLLRLIQQPQAPASTARHDAPIADGARNDTLSKMAFDMRKAGVSLDGVLAALLAENARCVPPLTQDEIEKIVEGKKDIDPDPILIFPTKPPAGGNGHGAGGATSPTWTDSTPWEEM